MLGLQLNSISRSFGGNPVLRDVNLAVARGEIVGFIGGNGAGKTTTMRVILGLLAPSTGEVFWDGAPITAAQRRSIGYMPEERGLYPDMKVGDQLVHFALLEGKSLTEAKQISHELTESLGLSERFNSKVQDLSLGNQQRVQLAVCLVGNPELLVLDEPFSGLDPLAVETMAGLLRAQAERGVGVLFSSHQLELVERMCDRVYMLDDGAVVAHGSVPELQRSSSTQWDLTLTGSDSFDFTSELELSDRLTVETSPNDPTKLTVRIDGHDEAIPHEILQAALRHPGLMSIVRSTRSLSRVLSDNLTPQTSDVNDVSPDAKAPIGHL